MSTGLMTRFRSLAEYPAGAVGCRIVARRCGILTASQVGLECLDFIQQASVGDPQRAKNRPGLCTAQMPSLQRFGRLQVFIDRGNNTSCHGSALAFLFLLAFSHPPV